MESRLRALALSLSAAGIPLSIESRRDRMRVQKAIYLIQAAGVSLGYRHAWYVYGPYSPAMTRDYYAIDELRQNGHFDESGWHLTEAASDNINQIKEALIPRAEANLEQAEWLELLASVLFLVKEGGYTQELAKTTVEARKPHLAGKGDYAVEALKVCGLL